LKIKTNHIRDEGKNLLKSNASLTEFNKYINTYQFDYIYVSHRTFYDRLVSYRNNLIVETAKLALESLELSKMHKKNTELSASIAVLVSQSKATNSHLSSLEVILTETTKKLESERVKVRVLYEENKELRLNLKVEKDRHKVEIEEITSVDEEPVVKKSSSLNSRSRKRTR